MLRYALCCVVRYAALRYAALRAVLRYAALCAMLRYALCCVVLCCVMESCVMLCSALGCVMKSCVMLCYVLGCVGVKAVLSHPSPGRRAAPGFARGTLIFLWFSKDFSVASGNTKSTTIPNVFERFLLCWLV